MDISTIRSFGLGSSDFSSENQKRYRTAGSVNSRLNGRPSTRAMRHSNVRIERSLLVC